MNTDEKKTKIKWCDYSKELIVEGVTIKVHFGLGDDGIIYWK